MTKPSGKQPSHPLLTAITPLVGRIGARVVDPDKLSDDDVRLVWDGAVIAGIRLPTQSSTSIGDSTGPSLSAVEPALPEPSGTGSATPADNGLEGILADLAVQFGEPLDRLARPRKQEAVRMLEESGAFSYRKSVETVAAALGISRFTVYNYLNRDRA
ncbi:MAG: helix-turn-helix domain-containing protein [Nakamurella sp.]